MVIGEAVGIVAAQSIGEAPQLTMHIPHRGAASRAAAVSQVEAKSGVVGYKDLRYVTKPNGEKGLYVAFCRVSNFRSTSSRT